MEIFSIMEIFVLLLVLLSAPVSDTWAKSRGNNEKLICDPKHEAAVGDNVTLDFHLKPERDVTRELVEWRFRSSALVLVYRSQDFSPNNQEKQFSGRASLDDSGDLSKGKLPVKILSVSKEDAGIYSCSIGKREDKVSNSMELIISDADRQVKNKSQKLNVTSFGVGLVTSTFLYSLW
ncbi:butyrophilin subfamily 2 member A2-like isoform X2 [Micropterus dolomieu]|uniref:butyrophilin subfamily 2 member A2-like isoform X2 n=1 Tax=Micropterus dolomieu TaxID=147949 RepID=UPI001E8DD2EC|nr:butyrophilin subfamily 2 member A2-like isoform X2 [Micropterus dolomieu]XP_045929050.1 butyrophilin subfamily 2 member A2-like isoform X2 [Micropterus dolomieu]